jgi:DNA-binding response OmpR family regulator
MLNEGAARLVLLGLPDVDGEEVLRAAWAAGEVPVIVLTARGAAEDRIRGAAPRLSRSPASLS